MQPVSGKTAFNVAMSLCDEFERQSGGRVRVMRSEDIAGLDVLEYQPAELLFEVKEWVRKFEETPVIFFYRGHFFWRISVDEDSIRAHVIKRRPNGGLWRNRTFRWGTENATPKVIVNNLINLMKSFEGELDKKGVLKKSTR